MKRVRNAFLLAAALVELTACRPPPPATVWVKVAPPPAPHEFVRAAPGPGFVWVRGYHRWDGAGYIWVPGAWQQPPRARAVWKPGHWKHARNGWYWVDGRWK